MTAWPDCHNYAAFKDKTDVVRAKHLSTPVTEAETFRYDSHTHKRQYIHIKENIDWCSYKSTTKPLQNTITTTTKQTKKRVLTRVRVQCYVHRDHKDYWGRGAHDGHLDFHTAPELSGPNQSN